MLDGRICLAHSLRHDAHSTAGACTGIWALQTACQLAGLPARALEGRALAQHFEGYDAEGFSMWFCNYKYDEENTVNFIVMNKARPCWRVTARRCAGLDHGSSMRWRVGPGCKCTSSTWAGADAGCIAPV